MSRKYFLCSYLLTFMPLAAQEEEGEIIIISERVGKEIDQEENDKFKIFEGVKGFQSAVYIKLPDGRYFLKIIYQDEKTGEIKISRVLQSEIISIALKKFRQQSINIRICQNLRRWVQILEKYKHIRILYIKSQVPHFF